MGRQLCCQGVPPVPTYALPQGASREGGGGRFMGSAAPPEVRSPKLRLQLNLNLPPPPSLLPTHLPSPRELLVGEGGSPSRELSPSCAPPEVRSPKLLGSKAAYPTNPKPKPAEGRWDPERELPKENSVGNSVPNMGDG